MKIKIYILKTLLIVLLSIHVYTILVQNYSDLQKSFAETSSQDKTLNETKLFKIT